MARKKKEIKGDAADIIEWIEHPDVGLRIPDGKLMGQPIRLLDFQKRIIELIYNNRYGTRTAIISMARKNAKTSLAALLLLVHLCGPKARPNSQLYSTATSRDQAALLFDVAAKSCACRRCCATAS